MSTRKTVLAALSFVVLYNIFFFHTGFGIGTGIFFLVLNLYFYFTRDREESNNFNFALLSSLLSVLFAFLYAFRSNSIVQSIDLITATFFSLAALYFYKFSGSFSFKIPKFILTPLFVVENFVGSLLSLLKGKELPSEELKKDSTSSLIKGLIIATPIFAVLLFLLTNADPIFGKLTQNLLSNIGERGIISIIVFIVMLGFGLTKFFQKVSDQTQESHIAEGKSHELAVICGSLVGLFSVFIFVQFRYLFLGVSEGELHQLGIASLTYSEYVRRGFFELLIASTIASGVVIYALRYLHKLKDKQKQLIQLLSAFLTVETGLLLLSAVKRVVLYADAHGLTRARIFGFIFLIWLALILVIFLTRIFKEMGREWFFKTVLASTLLALLSINLFNVDGLIATKYRPTVNGEVDYYYITSLSADTMDAWKPALEDANRTITQLEGVEKLTPEDNRKLYWARASIDQLYSQVGLLISKYGTLNEIRNWYINEQGTYEELSDYLQNERKWQSINLTEYQAYRMVMEEINLFEQISLIQTRINKLDANVTNEVRSNTWLDRATQAPLTP